MGTYINVFVVKDKPNAIRLDQADVVAPIQARAGVDHYGHELVQLDRVARIVRLDGVDKNTKNMKSRGNCGTYFAIR